MTYTVTALPGGLTATGTGPVFTFNGLTDGVAYSFTVTASNGDGTSAASAASAPQAPTGVASAPSITTVVPGDGEATVSFTPPSSTGGLPITAYTVTSSPGGLTATGSSSPITVSGLTDGVDYTFAVTATNAAGSSLPSLSSVPVLASGLPSTPSIATVVASDGAATVTITPSATTGGLPVTYTVTSVPDGITATGTGPTFTLSGLTDGQAYSFVVTANNADGTTPTSAASSSVYPSGVPSVPTVTSVTNSSGAVAVAFAETNNGGLAILSYTVTSNPGGLTATGLSSPIIVTGLTTGQAYTFSVTATNSDGTSAPSVSSSPPVVASSVPQAPTNLSVAVSDSSAAVSFVAPENGGLAIVKYTVSTTDGTASSSGTSSPVILSGLIDGQSYQVVVTATNGDGVGLASSPSSTFTPTGTPTSPTDVSALAGNSQAVVTFTPSPQTGGLPVTYTAISSPGSISASGTSSPIVVSGLTNGTAYTFAVTASNADGSGAPSASSSTLTPIGPPSAPVVTKITIANSSLSVYLNPPTNTGGLPILSYTAVASPGGITATSSTSPIILTGLSNGVNYSVAVYATTGFGNSPLTTPFGGFRGRYPANRSSRLSPLARVSRPSQSIPRRVPAVTLSKGGPRR